MAPKIEARYNDGWSLLFAEAEVFANKVNRILELPLDKAIGMEANETQLHNSKLGMRPR